jgi:VWFA-related protein
VRTLVIAAALGVILQQPTFRSRIDLMRLDVAVVDAAGKPVRDLRPEDFVVTLDGQPRRVTFARFYGPDDTPRVATDAPVSVATNVASAPGRVVILVADLESINPGSEKSIFETAGRLIERLGPSDAVGLLAIPGPSIDLTRDHGKVRAALHKLRGWATPPSTHYTMSVREAEAFSIRDSRTIAEVAERECLHGGPGCMVDLQNMVMPLLIEADRRTHGVVGALTSLFERIERIPGPKSVVLLSAGLQRRQDSGPAFKELERRAASAAISMSVVHIEQPQSDASRRGAGGAIPRADLTEGLEMLAGATDAAFYFGIATAAGPFDRIRNEIVNLYELGVERVAADADDRRHRLKVEVKRPGVTVRARKEILLAKAPRVELNPVELLAQPVDALEAPFAAATYMTRGEESATLKVILLVELLNDAGSDDGPASYAIAISQDGRSIFETADRIAAGAPAAAIAAQLAPGRYRLRAAVVDAAGRPGSLDMPIVVGLRPAGSLQFSDLIVGSRRSGGFLPATRVHEATLVEAALELYSANPSDLEGLSVSLEARRPGDSGSVTRIAGEIRKTALDRRRVAGATLPAASLSRGTWLISALVRRGDAIVGQVSRALTVE